MRASRGNADDPICLSSSDDEAPPPRARQPPLSAKAKGKQKAVDQGYASDASQVSNSSNLSITDILTSSQNVHAKSASKSSSSTPKAGPSARKSSSTSPIKTGAIDLTVDLEDDSRWAQATPLVGGSTSRQPPSSQTPSRRRTTLPQKTSAPKSPTVDPRQRKLSSMFKETQGAGSWSQPTPLIPNSQVRRKEQDKESMRARKPDGPRPGTWGNPEPLIIKPPRKRAKEAPPVPDVEEPPPKRHKVARTTARKSVGGQRMMAAIAAARSRSASHPASSRGSPTSPVSPASPVVPSPVRAAPTWNTQPDSVPRQSPAVQGAGSARASPQVEADYEAPSMPDLGFEAEMPAGSPAVLDGTVDVASAPGIELDDQGDVDVAMVNDDEAQPPGLVQSTAQRRSVVPTTVAPSEVETDELRSDHDHEQAIEESLNFQVPALRPTKGNHYLTSEDGDVIRTPEGDDEASDDDTVIRPVIEVPPEETDEYINNVLNPERDIEVILGPDPPKEPSVIVPFEGQAVPVSGVARPLEQPPDELRGKARREVGNEITEYNLVMRNLTNNPELQCEVFAGYIGQATAHDEPFAPEIRVVNKVDHPGKPPAFEFVYSNEMLYHSGVPDPELGTGCDCEGPCDPNSQTCSCVKRQELYFYNLPGLSGFAYDENERVKNTGCAIWECSETCGCPPECLNRVISRGRKVPVELFKTQYKGWGVRAKTDIPRGQFIGVYAGEMIPDAEAESRGIEYEKLGRTYLFDLDGWHMSNPPEGLQFVDPRLYKTAKETKRRAKRADRERGMSADEGLLSGTYSAYSVDAFHTGNFTRFINHSCDPNLSTTQAYFKDFHPERPCLVIIARRNIRAGEELCISYKGEPEEVEDWVAPLNPVTTHKQSKTSAKAHFSPKKATAKDDHCRCGAWNCDGKMFGVVQ